ncbi:hypothetical protein [Mucilaginibacter sp. SG564]|nr:hypothetical protein [Mucilaginibacter sp. SG564]NOW97501.1 hypothetical protein [Mucilaginibacter sp. SG564]
MKKTILLALFITSAGVLSSSTKKAEEPQTVSFTKTITPFKRDLGTAD